MLEAKGAAEGGAETPMGMAEGGSEAGSSGGGSPSFQGTLKVDRSGGGGSPSTRSSVCTSPSKARSPMSRKSSPGRRSSLAEALEKAEKRRELSNQMQEDLRAGAELNASLRNPENRRDPETIQRFWSEVKRRLLRRHGSIQAAFRSLDTSGDSSVSFIEFQDMLRQIHVPLDQRVCRAVFDKAAGGDRALSLEELQSKMMEPTITKLRNLMNGFNAKQERVQLHIQTFLKHLAQADEVNCMRSVDRFQRKLSVAFIRELYGLLLGCLGKTRAPQNSTIDRATYTRAVWGLVHDRRFQAYEVSFMLRIFERVDGQRHRSVGLPPLITTLLLLSADPGHKDKVALLFEVFDTDYDGCLQFDQILAMFRCICKHRPIADVVTRGTHDQAFQEELSSQEGLRAYERAHWYLQRNSRIEGGVVSLPELLVALERQPEIIEDLLPGTVRLHWLLKARPRSAFGSLPGDGKQLLPMWAAGQDPKTWRRSTQRATMAQGRGASKSRLLPVPPVKPTSAGRLTTPDLKDASEAVRFKKTVTWNFKRCIRSLGDLRLSDLTTGDEARTDEAAGEDGPRGGEGIKAVRLPSQAGSRPGSRALARSQSTPGGGLRQQAGHRRGSGGQRSAADLPRIEVPIFNPDKWGGEAADRFRLFCQITSSSAMGQTAPGGFGLYR